jgi:hypothetical protein
LFVGLDGNGGALFVLLKSGVDPILEVAASDDDEGKSEEVPRLLMFTVDNDC